MLCLFFCLERRNIKGREILSKGVLLLLLLLQGSNIEIAEVVEVVESTHSIIVISYITIHLLLKDIQLIVCQAIVIPIHQLSKVVIVIAVISIVIVVITFLLLTSSYNLLKYWLIQRLRSMFKYFSFLI